jgi:CDGSH-type Zn-finger protein
VPTGAPKDEPVASVDAELATALADAQRRAERDGRLLASVTDLLHCLPGPPPRDAELGRITPYMDGPYLVRGPVVLVDQDGVAIERSAGTIALCRCGRSQVKPFCDGTHKLIGFQAPSGRTESG